MYCISFYYGSNTIYAKCYVLIVRKFHKYLYFNVRIPPLERIPYNNNNNKKNFTVVQPIQVIVKVKEKLYLLSNISKLFKFPTVVPFDVSKLHTIVFSLTCLLVATARTKVLMGSPSAPVMIVEHQQTNITSLSRAVTTVPSTHPIIC